MSALQLVVICVIIRFLPQPLIFADGKTRLVNFPSKSYRARKANNHGAIEPKRFLKPVVVVYVCVFLHKVALVIGSAAANEAKVGRSTKSHKVLLTLRLINWHTRRGAVFFHYLMRTSLNFFSWNYQGEYYPTFATCATRRFRDQQAR